MSTNPVMRMGANDVAAVFRRWVSVIAVIKAAGNDLRFCGG